jgi:hypothetical protein
MANLYEFQRFHKDKKTNQKTVAQKSVDTNKDIILKFRVNKKLADKIKEKCFEKETDISKLNRILWEAYFKVEENNEWKKEVESWG